MTWGDFADMAIAEAITPPLLKGSKPLLLAVIVGCGYVGAAVVTWRGSRLGRRPLIALAAVNLPSLGSILGFVPAVLTLLAVLLVWIRPASRWFRPSSRPSGPPIADRPSGS